MLLYVKMINLCTFIVIALILLFNYISAIGEICDDPTVRSHSYTTTDGMIVSNVALVSEFSLTCGKNVKDAILIADVKGNTIPAIKSDDENKYQISWVEESSKISSGVHDIKVYDEEGYALLRKAQRNGERLNEVPTPLSVEIYHGGTYNGPWVQSECLAAILSAILWYIAFNTRSKLVS